MGLCNDSIIVKQFDDPLWVRKDSITSVNQWTCEEVTKWVTSIEGMPDNVGATFLENNVNRAALLAMKKNFKAAGVSKVGSLALLLEEIANLRREEKAEAQDVFVDHNAYCFGKIIYSLGIQAMCENKETLTSCIYNQDLYQEHFNKIMDYLFPGYSGSLLFQGSEINSIFFPKHQSSQIES